MGRRRFRPGTKAFRYGLAALGLLLVIGALAGLKFLQISRLIGFGKQAEAAGPPPEAVSSAVAQRQAWERTISAVGTVASVENVVIRNEVAGVVKRIAFESGDMVEEGALLVELDTEIERAQLAAAKARRELARTNMQRARTLLEKQAAAPAQLQDAEAAYRVAGGQVSALEAQLAQKIVSAPFAGRLGIRAVTLGQYLQVGTGITELDAIGEVFVDFTLPQEELAVVSVGMPVRVALREGRAGTSDGRIVAIDPTVDAATRSLGLRAQIVDPEERLRPGMFVDVAVVLPQQQEVVAVPATAIVHAAYGDSVFVLEEKKPGTPGMNETPDGRPVQIARQQFVRVGQARGDFVQIEKGLQEGQPVVTAGGFKLRNLAPVVVDNSKVLQPSLNPHPENR